MKSQKVVVVLTVVNVVLLLSASSFGGPARPAPDVAPVLRGRALEIVDEQGRVRASITVEAPTRVAGRDYPETVLLRLADPKSGPIVKITATPDGAAIGLSDDSRGSVQVYATRTRGSLVKIVSSSGREQVLKP